MRKSQLEKLDALLLEIGYSSRRRKTGISYIQGFFETVKKSPKDVIEGDIRGYLATTKNSHQKFWLRFFYEELIIHFYKFKFTRLEKRLTAMGMIDYFEYIRDLCNFTKKSLNRMTKNDVKDYISAKNLHGDELFKVQSIFKIFTEGESKKKLLS